MFDKNAAQTATARFPADLSAPIEALALVREFLAAGDDDRSIRAKLSIIVEELVLNIVEHGSPAAWSAIDLTLTREASGVGLALIDQGAYFDPREWEAPIEIPERGGGAGLAMVRAWAEIRDYARVDGVNRLDLLIRDDV